MKIDIPSYYNGVSEFERTVEFSVNENDTFNSILDFMNVINNMEKIPVTIQDFEDIKHKILKFINGEASTINFIYKPYKEFLTHFNNNLKHYPDNMKTIWTNNFEPLRLIFINNIKQHHLFIKDNKDEICEWLDEKRNTKLITLKEKKKIVNLKYYEKNKMIPDIKIKLTAEEKKERRKIANAKYYNKEKSINPL